MLAHSREILAYPGLFDKNVLLRGPGLHHGTVVGIFPPYRRQNELFCRPSADAAFDTFFCRLKAAAALFGTHVTP